MIWPTMSLDNFFEDPDKIVKFANSFEFKQDPNGKWPGKRTDLLHVLDPVFFNFFSAKVLSILYPMNFGDMSYKVRLYFQKISNDHVNNGWIHTDYSSEVTAIVYLSKHKECGTSLFKCKNPYPKILNVLEKEKTYLNKDFKEEKKYLDENNNQFEETISLKSRYNRLVMFDSSEFHAAQKFKENNVKEDRMTLIGFFDSINHPNIKYHGIQHKRVI